MSAVFFFSKEGENREIARLSDRDRQRQGYKGEMWGVVRQRKNRKRGYN